MKRCNAVGTEGRVTHSCVDRLDHGGEHYCDCGYTWRESEPVKNYLRFISESMNPVRPAGDTPLDEGLNLMPGGLLDVGKVADAAGYDLGEPKITGYDVANEILSKYPDGNPKTIEGIKKPPIHLVPSSAIIAESMAFKNGAVRYGPYNWRTDAVSISVYVSATLRHIYDYFDGEEDAKDSGVHHLAHARACLGILIDAASVGKLIDDRPPPGNASQLIFDFTDKS